MSKKMTHDPADLGKLGFLFVLLMGLIIMLCCCGHFYKFGDIKVLTVPMANADLEECESRLATTIQSLKDRDYTILYSNVIQELRSGQVFGIIVYK